MYNLIRESVQEEYSPACHPECTSRDDPRPLWTQGKMSNNKLFVFIIKFLRLLRSSFSSFAAPIVLIEPRSDHNTTTSPRRDNDNNISIGSLAGSHSAGLPSHTGGDFLSSLFFSGLVAIDKWRRLCFACHPMNFHCSGCLSAEIPSPSLTGGVNSICYRTKNVKSPRNGLGLEEEGSSRIVSSATPNSSRNILHNILNGEESWADLISPGWQCSHGGQKTFCSHNEFWRWFPVAVYVFAWTLFECALIRIGRTTHA